MTSACPIPNARSWADPEGSGANGVLILGEALGDSEAQDHLPFRPYAPAGSVLDRAIRRSGFVREQFVIANVVPVQPPKNWLEGAPWEREAIAWGLELLDKVVHEYRPRAILALGNVPLKAVTGLVGPLRHVSNLRGYVLHSDRYQLPVVATFHPSFLRRGAMSLLSVLMHDLKLAVAVSSVGPPFFPSSQGGCGGTAKSHKPCSPSREADQAPIADQMLDIAARELGKVGAQSRRPVVFYSPVLSRDFVYTARPVEPFESPHIPSGYVTHPSEADAWDFYREVKDDESKLIAYDIETPRSAETSEDDTDELGESAIISVQLSSMAGRGIFLPWREPFVEAAKRVLALPNPKAGANTWRFDDPLLAAHGAPVAGTRHDIRWTWHHLQPDLKASLQFIASFYPPDDPTLAHRPWKMLHASHPEFYGIMDVDVIQRILT